MRISEAALGLITRVNAQGEMEYLTQWNDRWQAYSLIGGHREQGESFRECCIREIEEELGLRRNADFVLAPTPIGPPLQFTGFSRSAQVETRYVFELFQATLLRPISRSDACRWVQVAEAKCGTAADDRAIAEQVWRVISHVNEILRPSNPFLPLPKSP